MNKISSHRTNQIIKNVFGNWAYYVVSIVIGFFLMPFLVHRLGDEAYGIWILVLSLTGYMGFFDLGIRDSIVKYVSQYRAQNDNKKINELVSTTFFSYLILGIFAALLTLFLASNFENFFHISGEFANTARIAFIIVGLSISLNLPLSVFGGVIWGFQRFDIFSRIETANLIIKTALIIFFVNRGFGLVALGIIGISTNLTAQIIRIWYAYKLNPALRLNYRFFKHRSLKIVLGYSFLVFIISIADRLVFYTDTVIIGAFIGAVYVTFYAVGNRLIDYAKTFVMTMATVLIPTTSELNAKAETEKIKRLFILGTKYSLMLILPMGIVFLFFGKPLINLWMGERFIGLSLGVLLILTIAQIGGIYRHICKVVLQGIGRLKVLTILSVVQTIANIVLSIILIRYYGLIGVALGTAIPFVIINGLILPAYVCRITGLSVKRYIKEGIIFPFLCAVPVVFAAMLLRKYFYPSNLLSLGAEMLGAFLIYIAIFFRFSTNEEDRRVYRKLTKIFLPF